MADKKTIVVSGVNLRKGGTLTIMRQCLDYLSGREDLRVVALVHSRDLYTTEGIEYIEIPWSTGSWFHRLWCEYVTMYRISRRLSPVWMWLSMHDTTPRVVAEHQEVYCHTSFPFLKLRWRDFFMDPKIPLFAMFTRFAYRINVKRNDCLIVQQEWFRDALSDLLGLPLEKFKVIPPATPPQKAGPLQFFNPDDPAELCEKMEALVKQGAKTFFYASTPDCHKNFELLCEASRMLEGRLGKGRFMTVLTISGRENRYSRWLFRRWGKLSSVHFHGFMSKEELFEAYARVDCFVFPSRVETWGLPISEFRSVSDKPVLLADLPYAHSYENPAAR